MTELKSKPEQEDIETKSAEAVLVICSFSFGGMLVLYILIKVLG